ncbi:MAG: N-acetylglucosamine-6-phosphate deacetylase [Acidobacteria bacterium]|nr:N-acetylglucosamine-6-phosphate deacetylase [Acidobacteriota bacterium]
MPTLRTFLSGADVVFPDRVASGLTLVLEGDRIVDLTSGPRELGSHETRVDLTSQLLVPGFVDVHVHGLLGVDVLDGPEAVIAVARQLPRFGVTAFCPTSVACPAEPLATFLDAVRAARVLAEPGAARVLPAHLESNFINPGFAGAQPREWIHDPQHRERDFSLILSLILDRRADVGVLTMAPEMPGGMDLLRAAIDAGIRVSLGHSGATFEQAMEAISLGARHATHLFNRMSPMTHREPGLVGAILSSDEVAAEIICDGHHVHPAVVRAAIAAKGHSRVMAITDGTAGAGLPVGACARLGGQTITVADVARLDDGKLAGSVATMDRVFGMLVARAGQSLVEAATLCSTTPARELGLTGLGVIARGNLADLVALTPDLRVAGTWVGGHRVTGIA